MGQLGAFPGLLGATARAPLNEPGATFVRLNIRLSNTCSTYTTMNNPTSAKPGVEPTFVQRNLAVRLFDHWFKFDTSNTCSTETRLSNSWRIQHSFKVGL